MKAWKLAKGGVERQHANGVYVAGTNEDARSGIGARGGAYYPFFQKVQTVTNVKEAAMGSSGGGMILDHLNRMWTWGGNVGFGEKHKKGAGHLIEHPTVIPGGLPLYKAEIFYNKHGEGIGEQPEGPIGPVLIEGGRVVRKITKLALGASAGRYALDATGRVLAWGPSSNGQLGNGSEAGENYIGRAIHGEYSQWAPSFVLKAGPAQTVNPSASNVLTGIVDLASGYHCAFFLDGNGRVWVAGKPAGFGKKEEAYAELDPALAAYDHGATLPSKPLKIAASAKCYVLLCEDESMVFVGIDKEGLSGAGHGPGEEGKSNERLVLFPQEAVATAAKNVVEVACTEHAIYALKSESGEKCVWASGSNNQGQLGLGLATHETVEGVYKAVTRTRLTKIASPSTVSEFVAGTFAAGTGVTGGDVIVARLAAGTVRVWGNQYTYTGAASKFHGVGPLGDGTTETRNAPVNPGASSIVGVAASGTNVLLVREVDNPGPGTIQATYKAGVMTVEWQTVSGTVGTLPLWREAEEWELIVQPLNSEGVKEKGVAPIVKLKLASKINAAGLWRSNSFAAAKGFYEITVNEISTTAVTGESANGDGLLFTANAGEEVAATWSAPSPTEPNLIPEWRRQETYPAKSSITAELSEPIGPGAAITELPIVALEAEEKLTGKVSLEIETPEEEIVSQVWVLTHSAKSGDEAIKVEAAVPNFEYPEGTLIRQVKGFTTKLTKAVKAGNVSEIEVEQISQAAALGEFITIQSPENEQTFTVGAAAAKKAEVIKLEAGSKAVFEFKVGSQVFGALYPTTKLTTALVSGADVSTLKVEPLTATIKKKTLVTAREGANRQDFHVTAEAQGSFAVLTTAGFAKGATITTIPCEELQKAIVAGTPISLTVPGEEGAEQEFTTTGEAPKGNESVSIPATPANVEFPKESILTRLGDKSITVETVKANAEYKVGALIFPSSREIWRRAPLVTGATLTSTFTVTPGNHGVTGKQIEVRVAGDFAGTFRGQAIVFTAE